MRIGEVADRLAINTRTIRYYEAVGLVPEPSRTQSGYRDYGEVDLRRIRFIKTARRLDLSIDEIREILAFTDRSQIPCGHVREVVRRKTEELDDRIAEMIQLRDELTELERTVPVTIGPERQHCVLSLSTIPSSDVIRWKHQATEIEIFAAP